MKTGRRPRSKAQEQGPSLKTQCDMEGRVENSDNNHLAPAYLGSISPASMRPFHAIIEMGSIFHLLIFSDGVLSLCLPRVPPSSDGSNPSIASRCGAQAVHKRMRIKLFINLIRHTRRVQRRKMKCQRSGRYAFYASVLPRFRSRAPTASSCESGTWSGVARSFPCEAAVCVSVSHMTSLIPLARASCDFKRATSSSSSVTRPSGRGVECAPGSTDVVGLGLTKNSQSRRSSSRVYVVTDSCVICCRKALVK